MDADMAPCPLVVESVDETTTAGPAELVLVADSPAGTSGGGVTANHGVVIDDSAIADATTACQD